MRNNAIMYRMTIRENEERARLIRALACPTRLRLLEELRLGERCLCELQPLFRMNKSTLSRHLAELRRVGVVADRRVGVRRYLRLRTPSVLRLLDCARRVIGAEAGTEARGRRRSARRPR